MFIGFKNKFVSLNKLLGRKLFEERQIKGKIVKKHEEVKVDKERKEKELLDKKYKEFEEKLKRGKKLTTEDLLGK